MLIHASLLLVGKKWNMRGRPPSAIVLTDAESAELLTLSKGRSTTQGRATHARIVLACVNGAYDKVVAAALEVDQLYK